MCLVQQSLIHATSWQTLRRQKNWKSLTILHWVLHKICLDVSNLLLDSCVIRLWGQAKIMFIFHEVAKARHALKPWSLDCVCHAGDYSCISHSGFLQRSFGMWFTWSWNRPKFIQMSRASKVFFPPVHTSPAIHYKESPGWPALVLSFIWWMYKAGSHSGDTFYYTVWDHMHWDSVVLSLNVVGSSKIGFLCIRWQSLWENSVSLKTWHQSNLPF